MELSAEQLKQYREDGYTMLGRLLSDEQLEALRQDEARFRQARGINPDKPGTHFFSKMAPHSETVRELLEHGAHVPLLPQLLDTPNVIFRHDQFVTKLPDRDSNRSEFPWHQDEGYEPVYPPTGITVWMALDDMTLDNGCIWVHPGSHKKGNLPHGKSGPDGYLTLAVEGDGEPALMRAGDAIAFTGLTLHRSKFNRTDNIRRAFFLGYADAGASFQPRGETEPRPLVKAAFTWMVCGRAPLP